MAEEVKKQEYVENDKNLVVETVFPDAEDAVLHSVNSCDRQRDTLAISPSVTCLTPSAASSKRGPE